jgi:hypothetical protein
VPASKGFSKYHFALAWLFEISESNLPARLSLSEFILGKQAKKALQKGLTKAFVKTTLFNIIFLLRTKRRPI